MADEDRRDFVKRVVVGGGILAVSAGFVGITTPDERGKTINTNNNVVVGNSKKVETLYQKTEHWDKFYKSAL